MTARQASPKQIVRLLIAGAFVAIVSHLAVADAHALPMFARRYGVSCTTCHTSPPRLNETGYMFRAAGFRMPDEIGKPREGSALKLTDYIGFRLQPRFEVARSSSGNEVTTDRDVNLFAAEAYIWYGPISKYFSSQLKVTVWPEESHETEHNPRVEGNLRFNYGNADHFVDIRAGVPHPMEGFGGSESYTVSNSRPFIQDLRTANVDQDTFFTPLGMHQAAVTVAYHHKRTSIRGFITGGMRLDVNHDGDELEAFGKQDPFRKPVSKSDRGGPDFQLFFNQIIHAEGGNISVYYYKGQSFLPRLDLLDPVTGRIAGSPHHALNLVRGPSLQRRVDALGRGSLSRGNRNLRHLALKDVIQQVPFFENDFQRLAFYAGYPIKKVNLLYGIQHGRDTVGTGGKFSSLGQFVEAMARITDLSAIGVRYDWFDPSCNKGNNEMQGITPYVNVWLYNQLRVTAEYQHLTFKRHRSGSDRKDDIFQLRLYWVK